MPETPKTNFHIRYACWGLTPQHVRKLRPDWDEQRALDFLFEHQDRIAAEMQRIGWSVLALALDEDDEERKAG